MASGNLSAYTVKIRQLAWGGLFLLAVFMGVHAMMFGGTGNIKLLAGFSVLVGGVLLLDKYYWMMCPAFFILGINLPGLPFDGVELGCLSLIGVYFIRQALHKEHPVRMRADVMIVLPVFLWICMVWVLNPTGIAMLGSTTIGARFYLKILLGFLAFLVLSTLRLSERDCKLLFYLLFVCSLFAFAKSVLQPYFQAPSIADISSSGAEPETSARYELLGAVALYTLVFSRYSLTTVMTSASKLMFVLVCAAMTVYSGKRRAFGTLVLVPVLRAFFTGRDKILTFACCVFGAMALGFAVVGHGTLWDIPNSAQRALSVVVPKFRTRSASGYQDFFRDEVRRYGREVIRANPWLGRKGFAMDRSETSWVVFSSTTNLYEGHAFSGNWHSMWYAFACDFGLPAMFLWAFFMGYVLILIFRGFRRYRFGRFSLAVYMYYAMAVFLEAIFSYTSGHSALNAMSIWVTYGMILAVRNGLEDHKHVSLEANAA